MNAPSILHADQGVEWSAITARGPETDAFLQGQLSNDIGAIAPGKSGVGLLMQPAGEVLTSLVCRRRADGFDLVVRRELAATSLQRLRRFLLRTRCVLEVIDVGEGPYATVGEQVQRAEAGPREFGLLLGPHAYGESFVRRHVSFNKGCFTGQELVARLDARGGNVPFRMVRASGPDVDALVNVVQSTGPRGDPPTQGVYTVVRAPQGVASLAIAHRTLLNGEASRHFGEVTVTELPNERTLDR